MLSKKKCLTFNIILKLKIIVPKEKLLAVNGTKFWGSSIGFHFAVSLSTIPLTKNKKRKLRLKLCETDSKVSTPVSRRDNNGWEEKSSLTSMQNFPGSYLIDYFYDFFSCLPFSTRCQLNSHLCSSKPAAESWEFVSLFQWKPGTKSVKKSSKVKDICIL